MRRILAFFGLALKRDLDVARIRLEGAADVAMIWQQAAHELADYASHLESVIPVAWLLSATSDTPKQ